MRVALVNKFWFQKGGTERVLFLTKQLLENAGHEVCTFGMQDDRNRVENKYYVPHVSYENAKGLKRISAGLNAIYNRDAKKRFASFLDEYKPDVIHIHNIYHQLSFSIFDAAKKRGIPIVMTLHDYKMMSPNYMLYHHGKIDESMIGGSYYRCLLNNCMGSIGQSLVATVEAHVRAWWGYAGAVSAYICPSEFVKSMAVRAGIDESRMHVVRNPVENNMSIDTSDNGQYVAYIGRLSEEKGLYTFLDAAKALPDIPHRIIGDGPQKNELEEYVKTNNMQNVSFTGFLSGDALSAAIQSARIVVVPSTWYEVAGLSMLEAILSGKIVIASDIGAIPESIPEELLFPSGNSKVLAIKIDEWYTAPKARRDAQVLVCQQVIAGRHTPSIYVNQLVSLYESVVSSYIQ